MVGALQVQLMLLLQPRLEQLQPQLPAWGRAGGQGRAPGKGLGRRQGEQPGPGHPSSPIPGALGIVPLYPCPGPSQVLRSMRLTEFQCPRGQPGCDAGVGGGGKCTQQEQEAEPHRRHCTLGMVPGPGGWSRGHGCGMGLLKRSCSRAPDPPGLISGTGRPGDIILVRTHGGHRGTPAAKSPALPNA